MIVGQNKCFTESKPGINFQNFRNTVTDEKELVDNFGKVRSGFRFHRKWFSWEGDLGLSGSDLLKKFGEGLLEELNKILQKTIF